MARASSRAIAAVDAPDRASSTVTAAVSTSRSISVSPSASCARSCASFSTRCELVGFVARALAVDVYPARPILHFAMLTLGFVQRRAHASHGLPRFIFTALLLRKRFTRLVQLFFMECSFARRLLAIAEDPLAVRLAFVGLELGALASRHRVALALFRHCHLAPDLLHMLALCRHETKQLGALRLGRGAIPVRGIALLLGGEHGFFGLRGALSQFPHTVVESLKLIAPGFDLAFGERDLDGEAARSELGISLRPFPLAGKRPHLALHLGDQIVETLQIDGRFLEPTFGGTAAVAIEPDTGRLLEQLPAVIRAIG